VSLVRLSIHTYDKKSGTKNKKTDFEFIFCPRFFVGYSFWDGAAENGGEGEVKQILVSRDAQRSVDARPTLRFASRLTSSN
jgi:hypothetical protein